MPLVVIYTRPEDGGTSVATPCPADRRPGESEADQAARVAQTDVPAGATNVRVIDAADVPLDLAAYKAARVAAIDARTDQLLAAGFAYTTPHDGQTYSFVVSRDYQGTWANLLNAAASGLLTFPFPLGSVDHRIAYLSSVQDVQAWYAAGVARAAEIMTGGAALAAQVQAAADRAGVDAITDDRS